eukprot:scaffold127350_cov48-Phaeocystis_antarctica.AAC.1
MCGRPIPCTVRRSWLPPLGTSFRAVLARVLLQSRLQGVSTCAFGVFRFDERWLSHHLPPSSTQELRHAVASHHASARAPTPMPPP